MFTRIMTIVVAVGLTTGCVTENPVDLNLPDASVYVEAAVDPEYIVAGESCGNAAPGFEPVRLTEADIDLPEPGDYVPEEEDEGVDFRPEATGEVRLLPVGARRADALRRLDPRVSGIDPELEPERYAELKHAALDEE